MIFCPNKSLQVFCDFSNPLECNSCPVPSSFGILLYQFAADGEVEDGLAQGLDLVGAGGERDEVIEGEGGVVLKYSRVGIGLR